MNHELPDVQAGFRKGRGTRDQIAYMGGLSKKQESSRITSTSALLTMPKPLCGSQQTVECTIYSTLLCFYFFFQVISLYYKAFQVKIILTDFY